MWERVKKVNGALSYCFSMTPITAKLKGNPVYCAPDLKLVRLALLMQILNLLVKANTPNLKSIAVNLFNITSCAGYL